MSTQATLTRSSWRYGLLGWPLAFVSLPLYVTLPRHYAEQYGMPLGTLGAILLLTRLLDATLDPYIGQRVDRWFADRALAPWRAAALAALCMALGFACLWHPPVRGQALLVWLCISLVITYLSFSVVSMVHQAWGARWGGNAAERAHVVAWREGAALVGVLTASILPAWLGLSVTSLVLALGLLCGLWALHTTLSPDSGATGQPETVAASSGDLTAPWRVPSFVALMIVFLLNGTASAIPATLLPFFVRDTLQSAAWEPTFLGAYFLAAALGLPIWVRLTRRWGLGACWLAGMLMAIIAFCAVPWLGAGDNNAFLLICVFTGFALGADLAIPGALLTGLIHHNGLGQQQEGQFFGWWTAATKLNLALASGLALPILAWAGYQTGVASTDNQHILGWTYGGLPCLFKLAAAAWLWRSLQRHSDLKA
ncbi:MAG: MFS transporter [Aquabacterium sp.]